MKAIWNDKIIAESDETIIVEGNHYFPPESVQLEFIRSSDHHSYCPWKGTANYYHLYVDGKENPNSAWYYPVTSTAAKNIEGYVAFWRGVQIQS